MIDQVMWKVQVGQDERSVGGAIRFCVKVELFVNIDFFGNNVENRFLKLTQGSPVC